MSSCPYAATLAGSVAVTAREREISVQRKQHEHPKNDNEILGLMASCCALYNCRTELAGYPKSAKRPARTWFRAA